MSMPLVIFFSYSEARSHDAQSRQLHEGNATAIAEMQKSFLDRFKALRTRRKLCLVTYFISHVFSDIQSLLLIAQLADFTELKPGLLAMVYLLMGGYGAVANTQEVSNTLISFEGEAQFSTSAPLSCSRIGFYMSNSVITAINTFYVCSHFLTNLDSLIDYDFFQPSFLGISAGALTLSLIPVLSFSYAEAKAADAQSQQLTEESESTSSSSSGLTFFERFKRLSMEQKFCVFGHLFSDVFSDIQCLVLLLNLSDVEDHVPFWALSLLYVAMFAYGFVTDYQVVPNTIAGFESENGPRYALIRAASDLSMAENGNGHPKGLGSDSDEERKPQKMEDAEHELSS
jgi:hypothetical protein